jgi:hypothetical protein
VSTRRASATSGNNTCVTPQSRQRPRRGRTQTGAASSRRTRPRANPHRDSTPPHAGQPTTPTARSASTRSGSLHTMSTMPPASPGGPPRAQPRGQRGGPCANRTSQRCRRINDTARTNSPRRHPRPQ